MLNFRINGIKKSMASPKCADCRGTTSRSFIAVPTLNVAELRSRYCRRAVAFVANQGILVTRSSPGDTTNATCSIVATANTIEVDLERLMELMVIGDWTANE